MFVNKSLLSITLPITIYTPRTVASEINELALERSSILLHDAPVTLEITE